MKNTTLSLIMLVALTIPLGLSSGVVATSPPIVTFDHWGGNEYWVEVKVSSSHPVQYVQVAVMDDRFHGMGQASWDPSIYYSGIRIPPGKLVQFRAGIEGSDTVITSCFFTHPGGVERCDVTQEPFRASFRSPSGNEWWQQVYVDSNRPIRAVWVDITGPEMGTGYLTLRSWGAWADSHHAPPGSVVRFGMLTSTNEGAQSQCYNWPQVTVTACPGEEPQPTVPVFDHVKGNEWWVEAKVGPMEPQFVFARDTNGAWVQLTKRSWGVWAASFHIEPGHQVQFEAHVDNGRYDSCWFTHPQGMTPQNDQTCRGGFVGAVNPHA